MHPSLGYRVRAEIASPSAASPEDATMNVGYARVSTTDQDLGAELDALKKAGAATIYREKISGAHSNRPALKKLLATLKRGDTLVVTRLDRLGRSVRELLNLLADFERRGVGFKSLGDPWADTTSPHGRLMLTVLGGLAEFERSLIIARTSEGRERAKANGVRFGKPKKMSAYQQALKGGGSPEPYRPILLGERQDGAALERRRGMIRTPNIKRMRRLVAVIAWAAIVAAFWCWVTSPTPPQPLTTHLPRAPLMLYSEIG
jgi:DNA invertase Pin-like site-specific DNA recombinase